MNFQSKKGEYLESILRSRKTVFTIESLALLWTEDNRETIKKRLSSYVKAGKLLRLRRGIYAKDDGYSRLELATCINTPAYVSFETVLLREGVVFQYYESIFVASYLDREIKIGKQKYIFKKIKDYVLRSGAGIEYIDGVPTASKERAFLDRLYVSKRYYFDNLDILDFEKVLEIIPIYNSKTLEKKVYKLIKNQKDLPQIIKIKQHEQSHTYKA